MYIKQLIGIYKSGDKAKKINYDTFIGVIINKIRNKKIRRYNVNNLRYMNVINV